MMGIRAGHKTGLGQILDPTHGRKLLDVMQRKQHDPRWLFAIPKCLWELPQLSNNKIDDFLDRNNVDIHGYERDMVLDDLARDAGLYPLISQLQEMDTVVIGPKELEESLMFLDYKKFVGITSPNLHMSPSGLQRAITDAQGHKDTVYLLSAGVSSPIIIDRLYDAYDNNFYLDCGSIWDAFAGIGGQREWRHKLYQDVEAYKRWIGRNLYGDKYQETP